MRFTRLLLGMAVVIPTQNCRTRANSVSGALATEEVFERPEFTCPNAAESVVQYSLIGSIAHTKGETQLVGDFAMEASSGNYLNAVRYDMCMDAAGENMTLHQIVTPGGTIGLGRLKYYVYTPEALVPNPGLLKLIATGDYADLEIVMYKSPTEGLLIHGWTDAQGKGFATMSRFTPHRSRLKVPVVHQEFGDFTPAVLYGELVEGDATINSLKNNDRSMTGPNLNIELRYDISGQPGMYVGYQFHSVTIKDTNPALAQPIDATLLEPFTDDILKINQTHHSLFDSMLVTVDGATYRIGPGSTPSTSGIVVNYVQPGPASVTHPLACTSLALCGTVLAPAGGNHGGGGFGLPPGGIGGPEPMAAPQQGIGSGPGPRAP